jgi:hypothetical protein
VATSSVAASSVAIDVVPSTASVGHRQSVQLNATVTGTAVSGVTWAVDCGSITQTGLFTAPDSDAVCNVAARPEADATKSASATVTVSASAPLVSASGPNVGWSAKCAAEPMRTTGTTYYACDCQTGSAGGSAAGGCQAGNDSNSGTNPSTPVKSWSKIQSMFQSMKAGDTVALCRGGKFDGSTVLGWHWVNYDCRPGSTTSCIVRDYVAPWASGSEAQPIVDSKNLDGPVWIGGGPTIVQGYRFLNLAFVNSQYYTDASTAKGVGINVGDNASDLEVCNCTFDGFGTGIYTGLGYPACIGKDGVRGQRRNFRGNTVKNNCTMGALVEDHNSDYDGNVFDNNGHDTCNGFSHLQNAAGGTTHTWYLASRCDAQNVRFINNKITRGSFYQGHCTQSQVNMNGSVTGTVIENNDFDGSEPGGTCGFAFGDNSYESASPPFHGARNVTIRRNRIKVWSGQAIGLSCAPNALIEGNVIQVLGSMANMQFVIGLPHGSQNHWTAGSDVTSNGTVRNNTIYITGANGSNEAAISIGNDSPAQTGFNVTGNAIYAAPGTSLGRCFIAANKDVFAMMNNNLCYGASNWTTASGDYSLSGWRTFAGRDGASSTAAPQFVNAPADLTPAANSPLLGAGSTLSTCSVLVGGTLAANQPCSAPTIVGSVTWSATDTGWQRAGSANIGAY